jgi:hypothetical protein
MFGFGMQLFRQVNAYFLFDSGDRSPSLLIKGAMVSP